MKDKKEVFLGMDETWGPVVARSEVKRFTGGLICGRTMANLDSQGLGPEGKIKMGRNVGYTTTSLIEWLHARIEAQQASGKSLDSGHLPEQEMQP